MVRSPCLALIVALLSLAACTNRRPAQVCAPCGYKGAAPPLPEGRGAIPREDETPGQAARPDETEVVPAKIVHEPTPDQIVEDMLVKKMVKGLHWEEVNLDQAIAYLRTITGINFYVTPKVREEKFEEVLISAELDDVSVKTILDVVLTQPFGLRWGARDGVIWVLTSEEIDGPTHLRYFDVKDLCKPGSAFVGTPVGEPGPKPGAAPQPAPVPGCEALLDDLRDEVHPAYWDKEGVTLEARNGILIVRASRAVLDAVEEFLENARRKAAPPISADMQKALDDTQVNFSMEKGSLSDAVKTLQVQTGMNLMIDPRIEADVANTIIVGMQLKDAALGTALNMLAAAAGEKLLWISRGSVMILTHREFLED